MKTISKMTLALGISLLIGCKDHGTITTQLDPVSESIDIDERTVAAEQVFREQLSAFRYADLELSSFEKTDGYSQDYMGLEYYQLEFRAIVRSEEEVDFYHRYDGSIRKISNHTVEFPKDADLVYPERARDPWFKGRSMLFGPGAPITVTGTITLQRTENGWRRAQ